MKKFILSKIPPVLYLLLPVTASALDTSAHVFFPSSYPTAAGNPIDTSDGAKIQKETDIYSRGSG